MANEEMDILFTAADNSVEAIKKRAIETMQNKRLNVLFPKADTYNHPGNTAKLSDWLRDRRQIK